MLNEIWDAATDHIRAEMADLCEDVDRHPGEFTEDDLRDLITRRRAIRVGLVGLDNTKITGRDSGIITVNMGVYVIAADRVHNQRAEAALAMVERLLFRVLPHAQLGHNAAGINPTTLDAQNLLDGQIDRNGVAFWAVSFQLQVKR